MPQTCVGKTFVYQTMTKFEVLFVGCGAAVPLPGRHQTAQIVRADNNNYLIDCGEGTQMRLVEYGVKTGNLHQIFISHMHGDHVFGLMPLLNSLSLKNRQQPIQIFGPVGISAFIHHLQRLTHSYFSYDCRIIELETGIAKQIFEDACVQVSCFPLNHPVPTFGYRFNEKPVPLNLKAEAIEAYNLPRLLLKSIKDGADYTMPDGRVVINTALTHPAKPLRSFAFCSDTAFDVAIVPYIAGVSVLYHEASFLEQDSENAYKYGHSTARQAAEIARLAGVHKLVMGHVSGRYAGFVQFEEEARRIFANAVVANEGQTVTIEHNS